MKSTKQSDSITQYVQPRKLTEEQLDFLADMQNARILLPSIQNFIDSFKLPISKQRISERAERKRKDYGK